MVQSKKVIIMMRMMKEKKKKTFSCVFIGFFGTILQRRGRRSHFLSSRLVSPLRGREGAARRVYEGRIFTRLKQGFEEEEGEVDGVEGGEDGEVERERSRKRRRKGGQ